MNDNITGHEIEFDSDNIWSKPDRNHKQFHKSFLEEIMRKESRKIEEMANNTVPVSGKLMHDGECIGKLTSISFGEDVTGNLLVPRIKTIFCTHNSYNINRKTLIL